MASLLSSRASLPIPVAVLVWPAPASKALQAYFYGSLQGIWVIDWITFWGVIIFNTLVLTGNFDRFQKWMVRHATADIRIQTIMLAWGGEVIRHNMAWTLIVLAYLVGVGLLYYFLYPSVMQK